MATYMYKKGFTEFRMGYASTIAASMFILCFAIAVYSCTLPEIRRRHNMGVLLKRRVMHTVLYVISIVIALITGFPFLFLVINSFKGMGEYLTNIWMLPKEPYLGNYQMILKPDFLRYFSTVLLCLQSACSLL